MRQFNKFRGTKGWISMWERVIRFRDMIQDIAQQRAATLTFWQKYGDQATKEAFGVSRATLFRWQAKLKETKGKLEGLNKQSTAPKQKRRRIIPDIVKDFILHERTFDPQLSKDKLSVLLKQDGVAQLSASTVGRMLGDLKKSAVAYAYKNHSSDSATDFMKQFKSVAPLSLTHIQTDNGSEFAKHFEIYLEKNGIVHFHTYPRCPKQNSEIE